MDKNMTVAVVIIILIFILSTALTKVPEDQNPTNSINESNDNIQRSNSIDLEKPPFLKNNNN